MTKLTSIVARNLEVSFDTDDFTREEWKAFIQENVRPQEIERVAKTELFPLAKLKERAIEMYKAKQEPWL